VKGFQLGEKVHAYLISSVTISPETLDITGYQHPYWPGEVVLDREDYGREPRVVDYQDDAITFHVQLVRVGTGVADKFGSLTFPDAVGWLLVQLKSGQDAKRFALEQLHDFVDQTKAKFEELADTGRFTVAVAVEALDTLEKGFGRSAVRD
jgi:hypothetical protein